MSFIQLGFAEIEWVKCPKCKRDTAKATHCIYCGEDLGYRFESVVWSNK